MRGLIINPGLEPFWIEAGFIEELRKTEIEDPSSTDLGQGESL